MTEHENTAAVVDALATRVTKLESLVTVLVNFLNRHAQDAVEAAQERAHEADLRLGWASVINAEVRAWQSVPHDGPVATAVNDADKPPPNPEVERIRERARQENTSERVAAVARGMLALQEAQNGADVAAALADIAKAWHTEIRDRVAGARNDKTWVTEADANEAAPR